jgi:hypothetical protein
VRIYGQASKRKENNVMLYIPINASKEMFEKAGIEWDRESMIGLLKDRGHRDMGAIPVDVVKSLIDEINQFEDKLEQFRQNLAADLGVSTYDEVLDRMKKAQFATDTILTNWKDVNNRDALYHSDLPNELSTLYLYPYDSGHSILCVLKTDWDLDVDKTQLQVPVPVKTVLRGYEIRDSFVVVDVPYDETLGLRAPVQDHEYGNLGPSRAEQFRNMIQELAKDNPNFIHIEYPPDVEYVTVKQFQKIPEYNDMRFAIAHLEDILSERGVVDFNRIPIDDVKQFMAEVAAKKVKQQKKSKVKRWS